jgi:hypothetical protein
METGSHGIKPKYRGKRRSRSRRGNKKGKKELFVWVDWTWYDTQAGLGHWEKAHMQHSGSIILVLFFLTKRKNERKKKIMLCL